MKKPPGADTPDGQPNPKQRNLMPNTTALITTVAEALAAHGNSHTEQVSVRTAGTSDWQTTYVTTCTCGVTTSDHPMHVAEALSRAGLTARFAADEELGKPGKVFKPLTRDDVRAIASEELSKTMSADFDHLGTKLAKISGDQTYLVDQTVRSAPILLRLSEFLDRSGQVGYRAGEFTQPGLSGHATGGAGLAGSDTCFGNGPVDISLQHASPSVDGTSTATVGDGQVTGVETAAPVTNAGVDLVLITLAEQLRSALMVERDAGSNYRSTKVTHQVASKILEDAQRAVDVVQFEIRKHVIGGAA